MKKPQNMVIDADLESKIIEDTMSSWQALLIKWRRNIMKL